MTTANIVFLIDLQNGFTRYDLTTQQGGSLYVPGAEKAGEPSGNLIRHSKNTTFVLAQDFHGRNHVSHMTSHPGVMDMRRERLRKMGIAESALEAEILSPLTLPFDDILLKPDHLGRFRAIACGVGLEWRAVQTDDDGHVTKILQHEISVREILGALRQKLWSPHGVAGTESSLFTPEIMTELPATLVESLHNDTTSPVLKATDDRGNTFYVVRKGMRPDLDSYGISTENDGVSKTKAREVFDAIAYHYKMNGVTSVNSYIGGIASNFCLEFSDNDVHTEFFPLFDLLNIPCKAFLISDISYGIPITVPSGAWPDLNNTVRRMEIKGKQSCTTDDIIRGTLALQATAAPTPTAQPQG